MIAAPKFLVTLLATGWLATTLAATNGDIDRGVLAYKNGDYDEAAEHYEAAEQTLGERPELHYNRGLVLLAQEDREAARKAFEHGTESDEAQV
ncbi:MAG: tetratricopeptide repeat protein, partial [Nannocystaceae bacterium]